MSRMAKLPSKILKRLRRAIYGSPDQFLDKVTGLIHVGANIGQERFNYADRNLKVLWVEPIPDIFSTLLENIKDFQMQQARQYLLADESGKEFEFHIATNNGESSSIFEFGLHKQMRPDISMSHTMTLQSSTFDDFVKREKIDLSEYQALLLDTQGSELLVLHGARQSLFAFQFIQVEAADFEAYTGGCTLVDISKFMQSAGWKEVRREPISKPRSLGRYYELLYSPA